MCVGRVDRKRPTAIELLYRLETGSPILAQPAYLPPDPNVVGDSGVIYAVSQDGFLHAIAERDGEHLWRFSTGGAVSESPVVIGSKVLVASHLTGMFCLDAKDGRQLWHAPDLTQFVSASKQRVYATNDLGQLVILRADRRAPGVNARRQAAHQDRQPRQ